MEDVKSRAQSILEGIKKLEMEIKSLDEKATEVQRKAVMEIEMLNAKKQRLQNRLTQLKLELEKLMSENGLKEIKAVGKRAILVEASKLILDDF